MKVTILGSNADRREVVPFVQEKLERVRERFKLTGWEIAVWLRDCNGPRGGIDQECTIRLHRAHRAPVISKCKHSSVREAITGAVDRLRRALAR